MGITEEKKKLRRAMLSQRASLDKVFKREYDEWICDILYQKILEKNCKVVHAYLPMGTEINISPLLEKLLAQKITVITPKTLPKRRLENRILRSLSEVEKGVFGTTHPIGTEEYKGNYDFVIIPGLAFDKQNNRLGYGGGYYDTFLDQNDDAFKQGIFYPYQEVEKVPTELHDVVLDHVLVKAYIL